jgi:anti-anti-sigma factor
MNLRVSRSDDARTARTTLTASGFLDLSSVETLIEAGTSVFSSGASLALDLSGVDFMDSSGVAALVALSLAAEREWKTFELTAVSPQVGRVLETVGLADQWAPAEA